MNKLKDEINSTLKNIYHEYLVRTKNTMKMYTLGLAINDTIKIALLDNSVNELLEKWEIKDIYLRASHDTHISASTHFRIRDLFENIKDGIYINQLACSSLIELVAAFDDIMIELNDYFLPNLSRNKQVKKKPIVTYNGQSIHVNHKSLVYAYSIYRHCFDFTSNKIEPAIFFNNYENPFLWINDTISFRHSIIHTKGKLSNDEFNNIHTQAKNYIYLDQNNNLNFTENSIDDIYHYHNIHIIDFINKMSDYKNETNEWYPVSYKQTPTKHIKYQDDKD